ncbi:LLM class flavin-dependent oxidoreductase [Bacillus wiedmannii]|uniref:LLM class flavin-dependent oxidoreductase n=1 Tax=Bacillus wiedmannii TaxID=1890302 RepID=UPI000BF7F237|nr:LLM class flavin-dependent oxidoreductase [Bacillus wiedmannii]PFZ92287.1 hypothetical protein COL83_16975 [Bacillus wiedmannii]
MVSFYSQIPGPNVKKPENMSYIDFMIETAKLSDKYNFTGSLVIHNHISYDPWIVAQKIIENTPKNIPLIAVQSYAVSPFATAKFVQSISNLYNRKVNLNFITGISESELDKIGNRLTLSERYERVEEHIKILKSLLLNQKTTTFSGNHFSCADLEFSPNISKEMLPEFYIAGSSAENINVAKKVADISVSRPLPIEEFRMKYQKQFAEVNTNLGIRIGIIARETKEEAWRAARERYNISEREAALAIKLNKKPSNASDKNIEMLAKEAEIYDDVFWLGSYLSGRNNNPFLVGSYEDVADYLFKYYKLGVRAFLIADLFSEEKFYHTEKVHKKLKDIIKISKDSVIIESVIPS